MQDVLSGLRIVEGSAFVAAPLRRHDACTTGRRRDSL